MQLDIGAPFVSMAPNTPANRPAEMTVAPVSIFLIAISSDTEPAHV